MTLNGDDIFGLVETCSLAANPCGRMLAAFPGLSGLLSINMGSRGKRAKVLGLITGQSPGDLAAAEQAAQAYVEDGGAYVLIDNYGNPYANAILEHWEPNERVKVAPGGFCRRYQAELLILN